MRCHWLAWPFGYLPQPDEPRNPGIDLDFSNKFFGITIGFIDDEITGLLHVSLQLK